MKRASLGPVSQSSLNSRASLGPSRVSQQEKSSRTSMAPQDVNNRRMSSINSRRSSAFEGASSKVDPRPIKEKSFSSFCVRTLLEYLTSHNYDYAISPKVLSKPSGKDFNNIVLFLFRQFDVHYACTGKFEDEVIAMFKQLKYPVPISKTALTSVGAPVTWPPLLASLVWMIELLEYDEAAGHGESTDDYEHSVADEKSFYKYLSTGYGLFLCGEDEKYMELEQEFVHHSSDTIQSISNQVKHIEEENQELEHELMALELKKSLIPKLQAKKRDYENDIKKFDVLIETLKKNKDVLDKKVEGRRSDFLECNKQSEIVQQDIDDLKEKISLQELSTEDVHRLCTEKEKIFQAYQQAMDNKAQLQHSVWHSEDSLRKRVAQLEEKSTAYNVLLDDFKTPQKIKQQLVINVNTRAKKRSDLVTTDIGGTLLPLLHSIRSTTLESLNSLKISVLEAQDTGEESENAILTSRRNISDYESKIQRLDEVYKRERESFDKATAAHAEEVSNIETQLFELRDVLTEENMISSNSRMIVELLTAKDKQDNLHAIAKREMTEQFMEVITQCAKHREHMQKRINFVKQEYQQRLENLLVGRQLRKRSGELDVVHSQPGHDGLGQQEVCEEARVPARTLHPKRTVRSPALPSGVTPHTKDIRLSSPKKSPMKGMDMELQFTNAMKDCGLSPIHFNHGPHDDAEAGTPHNHNPPATGGHNILLEALQLNDSYAVSELETLNQSMLAEI